MNVVEKPFGYESATAEVLLSWASDERANRLELLDSLYGSQGAVAQWGRTDNGKHVSKVIYVHGTNGGVKGDGRDREIAKTFKDKYIPIDISHQKPLNDENNPVVYDGKDAKRDTTSTAPRATGVRCSTLTRTIRRRSLSIWPLPTRGGCEWPRPAAAAFSVRLSAERSRSTAAAALGGPGHRRIGPGPAPSADSGHSRTSREPSTLRASGQAMACQWVSLRLDGVPAALGNR
jgi:hypothetical protein